MTTKTDLSRELTNAINDYGSTASSDHLAGMAKEDWQSWLTYAEQHGIAATVTAIDEHYAE